MDTKEKILILETAICNLTAQRTCAVRLGDLDRIQLIDIELSSIQNELSSLYLNL